MGRATFLWQRECHSMILMKTYWRLLSKSNRNTSLMGRSDFHPNSMKFFGILYLRIFVDTILRYDFVFIPRV